MIKKIYDGKRLLCNGSIILEIDNGKIYTIGAFNLRDYVGRVDARGHVYKGIGIHETYVGRIDRNGNLYDAKALGGNYVGNISESGVLRDHTALEGNPTNSVGFGLSKTNNNSSIAGNTNR